MFVCYFDRLFLMCVCGECIFLCRVCVCGLVEYSVLFLYVSDCVDCVCVKCVGSVFFFKIFMVCLFIFGLEFDIFVWCKGVLDVDFLMGELLCLFVSYFEEFGGGYDLDWNFVGGF